MEKVLSVSVACYNLGDMILDNLKSFCESSVADKVEVIVTDDGSKDNTAEIVEKYAKNYPNTIKLIKQQNQGPGSTVNSGIKHATGKYFRMVDGDDWVNTKNLEEFVDFLEKCDCEMVLSNYDIYDNSQKKIIKTKTINLEPRKIFSLEEVHDKVSVGMHFITYKTEILQKNKIVLDNCFYTDEEYSLFPIIYVHNVVYFDKTIYVYRVAQASQSVSHASMKKNVEMYHMISMHLVDYYKTNKDIFTKGQKEFAIKKIVDVLGTHLHILLLFEVNKENKKRIKNFFNEIKENSLDIFKSFKKSKRYKLLVYSNYILYGYLAKKFKQKEFFVI